MGTGSPFPGYNTTFPEVDRTLPQRYKIKNEWIYTFFTVCAFVTCKGTYFCVCLLPLLLRTKKRKVCQQNAEYRKIEETKFYDRKIFFFSVCVFDGN